jgi:Anti-sigma factor NepR
MNSRKTSGPASGMDTRADNSSPMEGILGKDIQVSIGTQLRKQYQMIIEEGVPDRFRDLLQRYDDKRAQSADLADDATGAGGPEGKRPRS